MVEEQDRGEWRIRGWFMKTTWVLMAVLAWIYALLFAYGFLSELLVVMG